MCLVDAFVYRYFHMVNGMTIVILVLNLVKKSDEKETTPNLLFHFPIWAAINKSSRQVLAGTEWNLQVTNIANTSVSYGYNQLLAVPKTTVSANLFCYGDLFTNDDRGGVSLSYILQQVGLDPALDSVNSFGSRRIHSKSSLEGGHRM